MTGTGLDSSVEEMGQVGPNEQPNSPNNGATTINQTSCVNQGSSSHHQDVEYCDALSLVLDQLEIRSTNFLNGPNSCTRSLPSRCSVDPKDQSENEKPALTNGWVNNSVDTETENASPASTTSEHSILANGNVSQYPNVDAVEFKQRRRDDDGAVNPELNDMSLNVEGATGVTEHSRPFRFNANAAPFIPSSVPDFSGCSSYGTDDIVQNIDCTSVEPVDYHTPVDSQIPAVPVDSQISAVSLDSQIPAVPVDSMMATVNWMPSVPPGYMMPGASADYMPANYMIPAAPTGYMMPGAPTGYMMPGASADYMMPGASADYMMPVAPHDYMMPGLSSDYMGPISPQENGVDINESYNDAQQAVELSEPVVSDDTGAKSNPLAPSDHMVYVFEIQSRDVGYLIGQAGRHVNKIKKATGCSIVVQPHPYNDHLRICIIQGTGDQVDEALVLIRRRFPLPEYRHLTLDLFNIFPPHHFTVPESQTLSLPEDTHVEVVVCHTINPGHFFLQQPTHSSYHNLETLRKSMEDHYGTKDNPNPTPLVEEPILGGICVVPSYMPQVPAHGWYRAEIVRLSLDFQSCIIKFLDYGGFCCCETSQLRQINYQFLSLPFQAIECYMDSVVPVNGLWSEESRLAFESITKDMVLQCGKTGTVKTPYNIKMPLVNLYKSYPEPIISIGDEMVRQGYAHKVGIVFKSEK